VIQIEGRRIARDIVVKRRDLRSPPTRWVSLPGKQGGEWNSIGFELLPGIPSSYFGGSMNMPTMATLISREKPPSKARPGRTAQRGVCADSAELAFAKFNLGHLD